MQRQMPAESRGLEEKAMPIKPVQVKDYMSGKLVTFAPDTDVLDAIHDLVNHRIAGAPVIDSHGTLVGMLSEFDCLGTDDDRRRYGRRQHGHHRPRRIVHCVGLPALSGDERQHARRTDQSQRRAQSTERDFCRVNGTAATRIAS